MYQRDPINPVRGEKRDRLHGKTERGILWVAALTVLLWTLAPAPGSWDNRATLISSPAAAQEAPRVKGIRVEHVDRDASETAAWIRIRVLSDTPPQETWNVIRNIRQWDRFMDLYEEVEVLDPDGPMERYRLSISPPWPISRAESLVRVMKRPADRAMDYWVEAGLMQGTYGRISVSDADGKASRILFENTGSPDRRFPDWMVKISVYLVVPSVLREIREQILLQMERPEEGEEPSALQEDADLGR